MSRSPSVRLATVTLMIAALAAFVPSAASADPPFTAKRVSAYSVTVDQDKARRLAKTFAEAANELDASCSSGNEVLTALSRVRIQAKTPARILTTVRFFLKFGHVLFGVDSTCQGAQKLSGLAIGLHSLANNRLFPGCLPPGSLLSPCWHSQRISFQIDRDFRDFAPDICYWTFTDLGAAKYYGGNTIRYRPVEGRCR